LSKKIIVFTSSARKKGNSNALAEAFIAAAEAEGHAVTRIDTADLKVKPCLGCKQCFSKGQACVVQDDFNKIAPAVENADGVVFVLPLYWYALPAALKAVLDKFYAFYISHRGVGGKKCALIACCEELDATAMYGVKFAYRKSAELLEWESVGEVLVPGVDALGDIKKTDGEAQAAALAKKF
jgi:multimeric flavodoxin WrbA